MPSIEDLWPVLETVISFIDEGVIITDPSGHIIYHNPAAQELLGIDLEHPLGHMRELAGINLQKRILQAAIAAGEVDAAGRPSGQFVRFQEPVEVRGENRYLGFHTGLVSLGDGQERVRLVLIENLTERKQLESVLNRDRHGPIITNDPAMLEILQRIDQVAPTDAFVLLQGESGTGKTQLARHIHRLSRRSHQPFVEVNCAAIPDSLIESELFGHRKGAFTGATQDRPGRFQTAHRGTLFLDEVSEIPLNLQAKLLRAIQDQAFEPVGADEPVKVDVRIIAASNRNLRDLVEEGRFRADLYYRLAVIPLMVPPLRERPGDIPLLLKHFCRLMQERGYPRVEASDAARRMLMDYPWPGNVRELENAIEHGIICAVDGRIEEQSLPQDIRLYGKAAPPPPAEDPELAEERRRILAALEQANGSRTVAASILGIDRSTLWRRMMKLGIK
ncbi:MAG: AAA family ATPase [Gammaproteobacteria bacterium]|nr:MAG: AAA family ATPase [Gammaproteobacteria bacterium]